MDYLHHHGTYHTIWLLSQALFHRLALPVPNYSKGAVPVTEQSPEILIWAGSTAVGQWAVQIAHASGYKVITTASPKNHQLLKEFGADDVYDYRDETTPQKIASKYPNLVSTEKVTTKGS